MKTGLILEGGAMRGMYTAGVLDRMMEAGIRFDGIMGVSAGALFGVNYLSGQKGRAIRYNKRFNQDKDYLGLRPLLKEGNIVSTEYAYFRVPRQLDVFANEAFKKADTDFYAVVTNLKNGQPEYKKVEDVFAQMDTLRASGSMPFVSKPVEIDGQLYMDGGVSDSIPFKAMKEMGYDRLLVVLTRDLSYRKKPMSPALISAFYYKYPEFARQLKERHSVYNKSVRLLTRMEKKGEIYCIRPSKPLSIGRLETDPDKLQQVYDLGYEDALKEMESVRQYLT